jgi:protein-disulfide isomerase/Tfp pilus assembly protein PilF
MRRIICITFKGLCSLLLAAAPALAQHEGHEAHELIGWVPQEILERPVTLRHGIGNVHAKVTTASPQAQAFYDQGLNYLSAYVWIEAARSFHQALRLDSKLAMAYAGLCDVYVALQDLPAADAALEKANSLSADVTDPERRRLEISAREIEFLKDKQNMQKFVAYRKAIYDALMVNPSDPGLWIQRGFADEGPIAGHGQTGDVDSLAFYEAALMVSPDNSAAHHYLAHTFENIDRNEEALKQSEAYLRLAPSIPHAHHMRGHELRRGGRIEEAIEEFRKASELENAYYRAERIPPEYDWHRAHNLTLLAACHQLLGQVKAAEQLLREAFSLAAHSDASEFNRKQWPEFLLQRGRFQEALEASQALAKSSWVTGRFVGHALVGRSLVAMNRAEEAEGELALAKQEASSIPGDPDRLLQYAEILHAEILLSQKKTAEGVALMKRIEETLRGNPGPDARSQALFELDSIAREARESEEWALAESTAREMVQQDPSYAGGYYALALVFEHQGDPALASQQFRTAEKLWSEADKDLPELERVRREVALKQSELPQSRQEYLKYLQKHSVAFMGSRPAKVALSFDPSRLRGSPQAPVIIIEFSDFQCPFCRKLQPTLKNLLAKYAGRVSLAYRDFPLREIHPQAESGAESSRCAGEQGKFWEYHDLLFLSPDKLNKDGLVDLARTLGLNEEQFDACMASGKYRTEIERDLQDGMRAGVQGTPAVFINGILLSGAQPEATFERIIQAELATPRAQRGDQ